MPPTAPVIDCFFIGNNPMHLSVPVLFAHILIGSLSHQPCFSSQPHYLFYIFKIVELRARDDLHSHYHGYPLFARSSFIRFLPWSYLLWNVFGADYLPWNFTEYSGIRNRCILHQRIILNCDLQLLLTSEASILLGNSFYVYVGKVVNKCLCFMYF